MRKEGLEPSRCYPQVPETCASTNSATFAGRAIVAAEVVIVKEPVDPQVPASRAGETPEPPAARLPIPPLSRGSRILLVTVWRHKARPLGGCDWCSRNRIAAPTLVALAFAAIIRDEQESSAQGRQRRTASMAAPVAVWLSAELSRDRGARADRNFSLNDRRAFPRCECGFCSNAGI